MFKILIFSLLNYLNSKWELGPIPNPHLKIPKYFNNIIINLFFNKFKL